MRSSPIIAPLSATTTSPSVIAGIFPSLSSQILQIGSTIPLMKEDGGIRRVRDNRAERTDGSQTALSEHACQVGAGTCGSHTGLLIPPVGVWNSSRPVRRPAGRERTSNHKTF